jgi:hypothetical protein
MSVSPHTIELIKKRGLNKKTLILIIILLTLVGLKYFIFDWMVPTTASFTLPHKWRMIPLRESKEIIRGYFGEPLPKDSTVSSDEWANGSKGKMYFLKIHYVSDTVAASYSIHYQFKNWFTSRTYLVDTGSIR